MNNIRARQIIKNSTIPYYEVNTLGSRQEYTK